MSDVTLPQRVQALAADAHLTQDAYSRLDILDAYLAIPSDRPHPQIKRIRDDHASQVATYLIALRNTADLFLRAVDGLDRPDEPEQTDEDVADAVALESGGQITLGDIAEALRRMREHGASVESIRYALNKVAEEG
ncbi:hypothetical protein SEA_RAMIEL05_5 [Microbacterium phage Ramiel05]|uniref:Uncharacterized protein n=3 Tax=Quhwahvirus TaxID=2733202 RepID=A0AAE8BQD9_9CAUD|nr:hypothetical protein QDA06_gp05 [Microbacterium phage Shotgun]QDP45399.1 hypothetical protein SEA_PIPERSANSNOM_6 [Microbacterium phage PiperSansNom]QGH76544.1 hypothetical protein SEA_ANTARES_6 [Microbacterium phage Antares]UQT01839.1 hypothetical protein SEA_SAVANNAH_5 [Microbacterium phage Savannah]URM86214.1 hypothetical protein SEA_KOWALSKI_5 [Microbacterium phage Kowalski]URM86823.1 hypothetical protein SEA_RAMIEL05_5 [Microbacterium phage Ramiel05]UVK58579.1 hypothetical protein SEA_